MHNINEDIVKQHLNEIHQEMERYILLQQARNSRNQLTALSVSDTKPAGKWRSLLESIMVMGRRMF